MKIKNILTESPPFKPAAWSEGYDAFWNGRDPNDCPYDDEPDRSQWLNGWQSASQED